MLSDQKPKVEKFLEPIVENLSRVNPNIITLLGSIPPLVFFVSVIRGWYILALVIFFGNLFDLIDGMIARKYNKVTNFGGFLDSTLDRISDFLLITAFAYGKIVRWEIAVILLFLSFLTSYIRAHGELRSTTNVNFAKGFIERPERLITIFFSLLLFTLFPKTNIEGFNIAEIIFLLLISFSFLTVIQRLSLAYKKL